MKRSREHAREIVACMYECMKKQEDKPFSIMVSNVLTDLCKHEVLEERAKRKRQSDKTLAHILTEQRKKWLAIVRYVSANGRGGLLKDADFDDGIRQVWGFAFSEWYLENVVSKKFPVSDVEVTEEVVN
jgi:hypothetical protein